MPESVPIRAISEPQILGKADIEPLLSDFLVDGWAKQRYELSEIKVDSESLEAQVNIVNFDPAKGDSGAFYLSNTLVFPIISQLSIIHILNILGRKKQFPMWLREYHIETLRRIRTKEKIRFRLQNIERFESRAYKDEGNRGVVFNHLHRFEVDDGAFCGRVWGIYRLPPE